MSNVYSKERFSAGSENGWNWLSNTPKWHYFVEGRSLCGKWLGLGLGKTCDDDPKTDDSPDNCTACHKKVTKLRAKSSLIIPNSPNVGDYITGRDGALLCFCGDARSDHPNDGPCNLNGLGHGIPSSEPEAKCLAYRANKAND